MFHKSAGTQLDRGTPQRSQGLIFITIKKYLGHSINPFNETTAPPAVPNSSPLPDQVLELTSTWVVFFSDREKPGKARAVKRRQGTILWSNINRQEEEEDGEGAGGGSMNLQLNKMTQLQKVIQIKAQNYLDPPSVLERAANCRIILHSRNKKRLFCHRSVLSFQRYKQDTGFITFPYRWHEATGWIMTHKTKPSSRTAASITKQPLCQV